LKLIYLKNKKPCLKVPLKLDKKIVYDTHVKSKLKKGRLLDYD
jgi:hypothetical protein